MLSTNVNAAGRELNPQTGFLEFENNAQTAKLQIDISHYRMLFRRLALFASCTGVTSVDPLLDLERFRLGGPNSVRAYAPAEISGDEGSLLRTALTHSLPFFTVAPTLVKALFDTGRASNKNHNLLGVPESQSPSGAGFALQTSVYQRPCFDVTLAQPIGAFDTSDTDCGVRLLANINAIFNVSVPSRRNLRQRFCTHVSARRQALRGNARGPRSTGRMTA
jgi:hemolysin activation/secretion protein